MRLDELNGMSVAELGEVLGACCGSRGWVEGVVAERPFGDLGELQAVAARVWAGLDEGDWLEAFAAHPRIGERARGSGRGARWSAGEQAGIAAGDDAEETGAAALAAELAQANRDYEARFGHVFLVCATGKSAADILALVRDRLPNPPATELRVAANEQAKITTLRLAKLIAET